MQMSNIIGCSPSTQPNVLMLPLLWAVQSRAIKAVHGPISAFTGMYFRYLHLPPRSRHLGSKCSSREMGAALDGGQKGNFNTSK